MCRKVCDPGRHGLALPGRAETSDVRKSLAGIVANCASRLRPPKQPKNSISAIRR
jgi:hypothetical protein